MKISRILQGTAALAVGSLVLTGCGASGSDDAGGDGDGSHRIVMLLNDQFDPYYLTIVQGAEAKAKELGIDFEWQAPTTLDVASQTALLKSVAATKPDGIIMSALDADAMVAPMKEVMSQGVPIVTVDADVNDESARLGTIRTDGNSVGALAAEHAEELTGGKGSVGYVGYTPGTQSIDQRLEGWNDGIEKISGLKSVGEEYAEADVQENVDKANGLLSRSPDMDVLYASWTNATIGAAQAAQQNGHEVEIIGTDASPEEVELLKQGEVEALVVQQPNTIGTTAVEELADYLKDGTEPEPETLVEAVLVTQDNMDDPEMSKYFYVEPEEEK